LGDALDRAGHPAMEGAHELGGALGDGEGGGGDRATADRAGVEAGGLDREIVGGIVGVGDLDRDLSASRQFLLRMIVFPSVRSGVVWSLPAAPLSVPLACVRPAWS
jgi:hypothetical protein